MIKLVHIGYPKAASTWLQRHVLSLPPFYLAADGGGRKSRDIFANADGTISPFTFDKDAAIAAIEPTGGIACLSNERWTGHPFSGGVLGPLYAQRIKAVVPKAAILIVIRSQAEMILSAYLHALRVCAIDGNYTNIFNPLKSWRRRPAFSLHYFDFRPLVSHYDALFGRENVIVLPFELLKTSPVRFAQPIYDRFDAAVPNRLETAASENVTNLKLSAGLSYLPGIKFATNRAVAAMTRLLPERMAKARRAEISKEIRARVNGRYGTSNEWLSERTGLNLFSLGY